MNSLIKKPRLKTSEVGTKFVVNSPPPRAKENNPIYQKRFHHHIYSTHSVTPSVSGVISSSVITVGVADIPSAIIRREGCVLVVDTSGA